MGRTSKFSFPVPGRKHAAKTKEADKPPVRSMSTLSAGMSKAQRLLGVEDLNIDSPTREDGTSWKYPSSRSSDMSISISESTESIRSTDDTESIHGSGSEEQDNESAVVPKLQLHGRASSTLLGQAPGEHVGTDTSSVSRRMRHEDSSSTLKSYYDRQKSPLAISQQTSESSARDRALRKGCPPVVPTLPSSPLLQVESSVDFFEERFVDCIQNGVDSSQDKQSWKKPGRLDLSMLFPSRNKRGSKVSDMPTPTSLFTHAPSTPGSHLPISKYNKLLKAQSKESMRSPNPSLGSTKSHDPRLQRWPNDMLPSLYDSYENVALSPHMSQIPESTVPNGEENQMQQTLNESRRAGVRPTSKGARLPKEGPDIPPRRMKIREHGSPSEKDSYAWRNGPSSQSKQSSTKDQDPFVSSDQDQFSWKQLRESMISPPWDSSAASVSSRNTKTSRASAFSNSDLKQSSVLSLSSNSDEEASDQESAKSPVDPPNAKALRVLNGASQRPAENRRQSAQQPEKLQSRRQSSRKGAAQTSPFLTIPEASATSARLSGPWSPPNLDNPQPTDTRTLDKREKREKRTESSSSKHSSNQPTPPLSAKSVTSQEAETNGGRFMAVTKQEEALLEALRQKRARMREKIIREHETANLKLPTRAPGRKPSRHSEVSFASTIRDSESQSEKHQILLYLDTPINNGHGIDAAEPSPDLSDFLSFGSDEDSTPRTSSAPSRRGQPRPDSSADLRSQKPSPKDPTSFVRLSAVGASGGLQNGRSSDVSLTAKKHNVNTGAKFINETKLAHPQHLSMDENKADGAWGMQSEGLVWRSF